MPLLKDRLKTSILNAMQNAEANALNDTDPKEAYADAIAQAVVNEIKQATITIIANSTAPGSPIAVVSVVIS